MKPEMITLKYGDFKVKLPRVKLAELAVSTLFSQVFPAFAPIISAPTGDIPALGTYWHGQGGIYAGVMRGEDGGRDYHLIFPNHSSVLNHKAAYGGYEVDESGATSLRDGMANTLALVESDTDHPAAEWCRGLVVEGHNDLYLPALHEYALGVANVPELFEKEWHVSSSQRSAYGAYFMVFGDGSQDYDIKNDERSVRPARRLFI